MAEHNMKKTLLEAYGAKSFLKVYPVLAIDQIKFSFAEKGKENDGIDCYMSVEEFMADFVDIINTGELRKLLYNAKKSMIEQNLNYGEQVYKSKIGKSGEILRQFNIQPGKTTDLVFQATSSGKGSAKKTITVGCEYRELKIMAKKWSYLEENNEAHMFEKYSLKNMASSFIPEDIGETVSEETPMEETEQVQTSNEARGEQRKPYGYSSTPSTTAKDNEKEENAAESKSTPVSVNTFKLKVIDSVVDTSSGNKALKGVTTNGVNYFVIISKDKVSQLQEFLGMCQKGNIISFRGAAKGDRIYFDSIVS